MLRRSFALAIALLVMVSIRAAPAEAGIQWERRQASPTVKPGQERVEVSFPFTVEGEDSVTITGIETSCGCTVAALEQRTYAPGESGEVRAVFTLGDRRGEQRKTVTVRTDDPEALVITLTIAVTVPEPVTLTPRLLLWSPGEPPEPKPVVIEAGTKEDITIEEVQSAADTLAVETVEVEAGRRYELRVRPKVAAASGGDASEGASGDEGGAVRSLVTVRVRLGEDEPVAYRVLARYPVPKP